MKILKKLRDLWQNKLGNMAVMTAVALPAVLCTAGAAVDYSRVLRAKSHITSLADQAALAAVSVDGQDRISVAQRFVELNLSPSFKEFVVIKKVLVTTPQAQNVINCKVEVAAEITTIFGGVVGIPTIPFDHQGVASRDMRDYEIVFALASSGTMCSTKSRPLRNPEDIESDTLLRLQPDESCKHFESMKKGVLSFVDIMEKNDASRASNLKIGLVPYNYKVRMPFLNNIPPSMTALEDANFFSSVEDAAPLSEVVSLTNNMAVLRKAVQGLRQTAEGTAWGRTNLGAHVAGLMLCPDHARYFKHEKPPVAFKTVGTEKAVVLISDGTNIGCCFTNHPDGNFKNQYVYFHEPDNKQQIDICRAMKESGVTIYTILLDVDAKDPGGKLANNVFAECASGAYNESKGTAQSSDLLCKNKQNCYDVKTDDDMVKALQDIAQSFYRPKLTQ